MWNNQQGFKISHELPYQKVTNDYVLLDSRNAQAHELNEVGFFIWNLIHKETSYQEILERLEKNFDADKDILSKDLDQFLTSLKEKDLLVVNE